MRITNGPLSGRRPLIPKNLKARPTTDMAREALFNILRNRIDFESVRVLDLFSGTGSISYEFASLGCPYILAVEWDRFHCEAIRKNLKLLDIQTIQLFQTDVFSFLTRSRDSFDLIFADPPYDHKHLADLPELIFEGSLLKPEGMFILEHGPDLSFADHEKWKETRIYGKVHFTFFSY
ncbi:MAG: RsmD family RNA methyltransferase [Bacteroidota bacterium]